MPLRLKVNFLCLACVFAFQPAFAQIRQLSPARLKAQTRKSQKEAALYLADSSQAHLEIQNLVMKRGAAGYKQVQVQEQPAVYVFDKDINAITQVPEKRIRFWKNKRKKSKAY